MNDFIAWALQRNLFVRIIIWLSLTAVVAGFIDRLLPSYATLVIGTIAAAFFAAVLFPRKSRKSGKNGPEHPAS